MRSTLALLATSAAAAALTLAAPAQATFGSFTPKEYMSVCLPTDTFAQGCNRASYQAEAEQDDCSCTGEVTGRWTGTDGQPRKSVFYDNSQGGTVLITYRQRNDNGKWQVVGDGKRWCDDNGCHVKAPGQF